MNPGKNFEKQFKDSATSQGILTIRFKDSDLSFNPMREQISKFTTTNPADFFSFKKPYLYFWELKSTKYKSISFARKEGDAGMIEAHQIRDLSNLSVTEGVFAGFLFNFRTETPGVPYSEITYFMDIEDFNSFFVSTDKRSITPLDIVQYGGIVVESKQRRKYYNYNIEKLLPDIEKRKEKRDKEKI